MKDLLCAFASWREISLGLSAFVIAIPLAAAASGEVRIKALSPQEFEVTAAYRNPPALHWAAFSASGVEVQSIEVASGNQPVGFQLQHEERYLRLTIDAPRGAESGIEIRYRVHSPAGRLPLFVPLQEFGSTSLRLRLELASGLRLDGESFPRFEPAAGGLEAFLANHPSLMHIPVGREGSGGRLLTPSLLTNLGLIGMALSVAACWLWIRRVSRRGAETQREAEEGR
ncbi:MAG: hypothetical protein V3T83_18740 [Acidobacteriota bacterium]